METQVQEQVRNAGDPHLLLDWGADDDRQRWLTAGSVSIAVHIVLGAFLLYLASLPPSAVETTNIVISARHVTPLIAPPTQLTQKAPNKAPLTKEFNVDS